MNLFIYLQSKSLIVITAESLYASCRFVGWDSYISLILNILYYQNLYMYMTIDNPTFFFWGAHWPNG